MTTWILGLSRIISVAYSCLLMKQIRCPTGNSYSWFCYQTLLEITFERAVHLELAQKLNRRLESIRAWFCHRRYNERKEIDGEEEEKTKRGKTQGRKINRKPKKKAPVTGLFSEESRQILFASFEANPLPGREKLFLYHFQNIFFYFF